MTAVWLRAIVVWAAMMLMPDETLGCSCPMSGPPCQAASTADAVFVGTVRGIESIDRDPSSGFDRLVLVRMDVERGWFVNAVPRQVEIVTGPGGGDCGYRFANGGRYLVYARKTETLPLHNEHLLANAAARPSRGGPEGTGIHASSGDAARVYGQVSEWRRDPAEERGVDYGPLEGVTVSLRGATFLREIATDASGRFEIPNLPPGQATVTVFAPFGFDVRQLEREIEIRDRGCSEVDFDISQIARASGTVVDASGRPIPGVEVEAVAAELAGFDPPPYQQPVKTDARGVFEFDDLPPGTLCLRRQSHQAARGSSGWQASVPTRHVTAARSDGRGADCRRSKGRRRVAVGSPLKKFCLQRSSLRALRLHLVQQRFLEQPISGLDEAAHKRQPKGEGSGG